MNIVQLTPGAGDMYCGNCFHDNTLVTALRKLGHDASMLPLYLPVNVEGENQSAGQPVFFGGINVYLEQKSALYRRAPSWLRRIFNSRRFLRWAGGRAAKTRAEDVGEILLSMLKGESGNQDREISELIQWLRDYHKPDVLCLSNALLIGMVRRIKRELKVPVVCLLQGEEPYLDSLPPAHRDPAWRLLSERAADLDAWIAPSRWNADSLMRRLGLNPSRVHVVSNGVELDLFSAAQSPAPHSSARDPVLGYFARMSRDKGLDLLVEAYIHLRRKGKIPRLKLRVGGGCGPSDEPFVHSLRTRLAKAGLSGESSFHPNLRREEKMDFLKSLDVFSVPAHYGEAFGLYLIEAMAAGVPVVQPRTAAFPEILSTGGGVLCEPNSPAALAEAIEAILLDEPRRVALGRAGKDAVSARFNSMAMANNTLAVFRKVVATPNGA
jgi:glycosyltransferase involved in cell wall biosynthesis